MSGQSPVTLIKGWLQPEKQLPLFRSLMESGPNTIVLRQYGTDAKRKNLVFYDGDPDAAYRYVQDASPEQDPKKVARPIPFADGPPELQEVRSRLQAEYGHPFNLVYINVYADETVGIGWHFDAEEVGSRIPVKMLCLGGTRLFSIWRVRKDANGKLLLSEPLRDANGEPLLDAKKKPKKRSLIFAEWNETTESGDLVQMPVGFHEVDAYRHAVLPQKHFAAPRISLTFRSPDLSVTGPWAPKHSNLYTPNFLTADEAKELLEASKQLPRKRAKTRYGAARRNVIGQAFTDVNSKRLAYVSKGMLPKPISEAPAAVQKMLARLSERAGRTVNYASLVIYENQRDHMNWHQHKEDKGHNTPVFIVSVGAERKFGIRKKGKPKTTVKFLAEEGSLITLPNEYNDTHEHAVLTDTGSKGVRYAFNCKCVDEIYSPPRVWDCHAGKQYPEDAVYVGCRVSRGNRLIREGTIFGNGTDPLVSHDGWLKTEEAFRQYAEQKMLDPAFRQQAEKLRGKHLLCWCVQDGPKRAKFCHARVWLELVNGKAPRKVACGKRPQPAIEPTHPLTDEQLVQIGGKTK